MVVKAATETSAGTRIRICKNDASHMETEDIPMLGSSVNGKQTTSDNGKKSTGSQATSTNGDTTSSAGNVLKVVSIACKNNAKKITGKLSVRGAKVKIKVGKKPFKAAKVKGVKFTLKLSYKLKKKMKVQVNVTKSGYKGFKKTYKVK